MASTVTLKGPQGFVRVGDREFRRGVPVHNVSDKTIEELKSVGAELKVEQPNQGGNQ